VWKLHFKGQKYTRKTRFTEYITYVADKSTALVNEKRIENRMKISAKRMNSIIVIRYVSLLFKTCKAK